MLPQQPQHFTTAEKDTYDVWLKIVGPQRLETVDRFLYLAEALDTADGQPWNGNRRYQMRQHVHRLIEAGVLVAVSPSDPPEARMYHVAALPPWGSRRPGARRK